MDKLYHTQDNDLTAYCCYLDFSKAFDKVAHYILLDKLRKFGIGGGLLKLFFSYLSDRYQCVKVGKVYIENVLVARGVPQGSILGPLLFVIFINDLPDVCNSSLFFLYADDSKMNSNSMLSSQSDLNACIEWSKINLMQFNAAKTQFLVIGKDLHSPLLYNGKEINSSEFAKDLGVYVSCKLTWSHHVSEKLQTFYNTFHQLKLNLPGQLNNFLKSKVYKTFILPVLLYASEFWYPSKSDLYELERFQKRVSRWAVSASGYRNRLLIMKVLPIKHSIELKDVVMFNKLINGGFDFPVSDYITVKLPALYSLRRNDLINFDIPYTNKKKSEQNFFFRASKYANFIQEKTSMDITTNPIQFKAEVKREFFDHFCEGPFCISFFDCKL